MSAMGRLAVLLIAFGPVIALLLCVSWISGCGSPEHAFAPELIEIDFELSAVSKDIVRAQIETELCPKIEEKGFDCNVDTQVKSLLLEWEDDDILGKLQYCLKADCPEVIDE